MAKYYIQGVMRYILRSSSIYDAGHFLFPILSQVLPIMTTLENLIDTPDEWETPDETVKASRAHRAKVAERIKIFNEMKHLQLQKLNRATYNMLRLFQLLK